MHMLMFLYGSDALEWHIYIIIYELSSRYEGHVGMCVHASPQGCQDTHTQAARVDAPRVASTQV